MSIAAKRRVRRINGCGFTDVLQENTYKDSMSDLVELTSTMLLDWKERHKMFEDRIKQLMEKHFPKFPNDPRLYEGLFKIYYAGYADGQEAGCTKVTEERDELKAKIEKLLDLYEERGEQMLQVEKGHMEELVRIRIELETARLDALAKTVGKTC